MKFNLKNKRIIITGSSSGIGYVIAEQFSKNGCKVILNSRSKKKLLAGKKKISNSFISQGDIEQSNQAKKVIKKAVSFLGGIDVLICNVGSGKGPKPGSEKHDDWIKSFKKNFLSATNVIEEAKKYLIKSKGTIICISSICGIEYINNAPLTYAVSKSALNTYVKMNSKILGKLGIRINAIAPGNIMFKGSVWDKKMKINKFKTKKYIKNFVPLQKFATPENISDLCLFLASDKSSFINGSIIVADGGQTNKFI